MDALGSAVDAMAVESGFSGAVRVDRDQSVVFAAAYGWADRRHRVPNTVDTQFALASVTKGLTALTVMSLVESGPLTLDTTARSVLGDDLPLIDDAVTVEHLLANRSGIGDYFDEDAVDSVNDNVIPAPPHRLAETEDYVAVLGGHETVSRPDEVFAYNNGGFVVLALIAERVGREPFRELVRKRVLEPADMTDTAFLRSDELPGRAALGYLEAAGLRTNVLHLPVVGSGDGGIYSTLADLSALWSALIAGRIVSPAAVELMVSPRSTGLPDDRGYGRGFWLDARYDTVFLIGSDAGVSCVTSYDPREHTTYTVVSNVSNGAWDLSELLDERLAGG